MLVALLAAASAAQAQSPPDPIECGGQPCALLRVHALTPERMVIPTIDTDGQDPLFRSTWVRLTFDGCGLFEWVLTRANWHQHFPVFCLGIRTVRATFNGITLEQTVTLDPGAVLALTFTFPRAMFDLASLIDSLGVTGSASLNRSVSLHLEPFDCEPPRKCVNAVQETLHQEGLTAFGLADICAGSVFGFQPSEASGHVAVRPS